MALQGAHIVGVDVGRGNQGQQGIMVAIDGLQNGCFIGVGLHVFGIYGNGLVIAGNGLLCHAKVLVGFRLGKMADGHVRGRISSPVKAIKRLLCLAQRRMRDPHRIKRGKVIGRHLQRARQQFQCLCMFTAILQGNGLVIKQYHLWHA